MRRIKPIVALATLLAVIVGENWLRYKMHQYHKMPQYG